MIQEILSDIYKIDIPLPKNPLRSTNSYFIRGNERNLLIDTGFNCDESREAMNKALVDLDINMDKTDIFITHLHSDHAGLYEYLATPNTRVWASESDGKVIMAARDSLYWKKYSPFMHLSGLTPSGVENNVSNHPGYRFAPAPSNKITLINEGFIIPLGNYNLQCITTKGHSDGHMCLYEPDKKILFSGDHILGKITPNITLWKLGEDALGEYLDHLDKIAALEIDIVLPGHRGIIYDCRSRIEELKIHHEKRMDDVMSIIGEKSLNATEVASQMKWDLSYRNWVDFPWGQKLFATGEALSHLYHLMIIGKLAMFTINGILYFKIV